MPHLCRPMFRSRNPELYAFLKTVDLQIIAFFYFCPNFFVTWTFPLTFFYMAACAQRLMVAVSLKNFVSSLLWKKQARSKSEERWEGSCVHNSHISIVRNLLFSNTMIFWVYFGRYLSFTWSENELQGAHMRHIHTSRQKSLTLFLGIKTYPSASCLTTLLVQDTTVIIWTEITTHTSSWSWGYGWTMPSLLT